MRVSQNTTPIDNPFAPAETSHNQPLPNTNNYPYQNHTHLKLSFPKFNGDDLTGWIFKAEQYFDFDNVVPDQQGQLASFHLEGIALQWLRWLTKFRGPLNWSELTKALLLHFSPTDYEHPSEALTHLKQTSTIASYQETFEMLSHWVDGVEYTKKQQLYRILVPSCLILLTFCIRIGTFDRSRVSGLVEVFRVSCIIVTRVCVQRANMDHWG